MCDWITSLQGCSDSVKDYISDKSLWISLFCITVVALQVIYGSCVRFPSLCHTGVRGFAKKIKIQKSEINMEVGWWVQV